MQFKEGRLQGRVCTQYKLSSLSQPCSVAFQQNEAPAAEGCCWSMLAWTLHNAPFIGPKHGLCPSPTERSWASPCTLGASIYSTEGGNWRNWSKEEKLGSRKLSQVHIKPSQTMNCNFQDKDTHNRYTKILHMLSQTSIQ